MFYRTISWDRRPTRCKRRLEAFRRVARHLHILGMMASIPATSQPAPHTARVRPEPLGGRAVRDVERRPGADLDPMTGIVLGTAVSLGLWVVGLVLWLLYNGA